MTKPKKTRRNSGRVFPKCKVPQSILNEEGIVEEEYWDDWVDHRDGFRDNMNLEQKRKEKRRSKRRRK